MRLTEPLRDEHADLLPHLVELDAVAAGLDHWQADTAQRLDSIVKFLRGHLIPHAQAEEAVLYPAVERVMGAPGATDTMKADHDEIVARIDRLAGATATVGTAPRRPSRPNNCGPSCMGSAPSCTSTSGRRKRCFSPCSTPT